MSDRDLQEIQALQFSDLEAATGLLKQFLNTHLPFEVVEARLRPSAVSLNSINGSLISAAGERLFFKTHVEPQSLINEYYNSTILAEAGYPVMQPLYSSTEWGKQLLIYPFFESPSLFQIAREIELEQRQDGESVLRVQQQADEQLRQIYMQTLQWLTAADQAQAPIHQLFSHRLTGGRFEQFYQGQRVALPEQEIEFEQLASLRWVINGLEFQQTLGELIERAVEQLHPGRCDGPAIVGHGDAHNGNVFIDRAGTSLIYFDPAFAGRHSPLLDLAKPLFHNVFAIWMYFPQAVADRLSIRATLDVSEKTIAVEHDFVPSDFRLAVLRSKLDRVLLPVLQELQSRGWLAEDWRQDLKLALFCCPFLTMNLRDVRKFPAAIALLGLATSIEMGSTASGNGRSILAAELDRIADELS